MTPRDTPSSTDTQYDSASAMQRSDFKFRQQVSQSNNMADQMYGSDTSIWSVYKYSFTGPTEVLRDATGMSGEEGDAFALMCARAFHDAAIPLEEASGLYQTICRYTADPADDATVKQWEKEARRQSRERWGDQAEERMAKVHAFIDARPDLKRDLSHTGLGSNPRLIMALAQNANQLRITPWKRA